MKEACSISLVRHTREPVSVVVDSMVKKTLACNTEKSLRVALHGENS